MKSKIVKIKMHGILAEQIKPLWNLAVKSVAEAVHAINVLTNNHFNYILNENDKKQIKYHVIVNGKKIELHKEINEQNLEEAKNSELCMNIDDLETIDFVPIIEGADSKSILAIIAGVVLVIVGILITIGTLGGGTALGVAVIIAGLGLVAAGVINLLSKPPQFEDFREISGNKKASYFFNGPENTVREGGPVPVGYGRLLIGSQVISASYEVSQNDATQGFTI